MREPSNQIVLLLDRLQAHQRVVSSNHHGGDAVQRLVMHAALVLLRGRLRGQYGHKLDAAVPQVHRLLNQPQLPLLSAHLSDRDHVRDTAAGAACHELLSRRVHSEDAQTQDESGHQGKE